MKARALGSEFSVLHGSLRKPNMKLQCFLGKLSIVAQELCVKLSVEFCAVPCGLYEEGKGECNCYDRNTERRMGHANFHERIRPRSKNRRWQWWNSRICQAQ
jgi:hypothetical protein